MKASGMGQGCGCSGELVWALAMGPGGGADRHWGTRKWKLGRPGGLDSATWEGGAAFGCGEQKERSCLRGL